MTKKNLLRIIGHAILNHYHSYEITFNIKFDVSPKCEEDFKFIENIISESYPDDYDNINLENQIRFYNLFKDKTSYTYLKKKTDTSQEHYY